MTKVHKVTILGGTDGFGKWLGSFALSHFGENVSLTLTGRNREKGELCQQELSKKYNTQVLYTDDNIIAVGGADVVIYAVPISKTQSVIEDTLSHIPAGAIVTDITSIKGFPTIAMQKRADLVVIPTHPMFSERESSVAGQICILTPAQKVKDHKYYVYLKKFLSEQDLNIIETSPEEHDTMMAITQGLTHCNMFVIGGALDRLGVDVSKTLSFFSPIYKLLISSVGRYLGHNPGLYADIQMHNESIGEVHTALSSSLEEFSDTVSKQDYERFAANVERARVAFGEENCKRGQSYTDKVTFMMAKQREIVSQNIGKQITLRDIYSEEEFIEVVQGFEGECILCENDRVYDINSYLIAGK